MGEIVVEIEVPNPIDRQLAEARSFPKEAARREAVRAVADDDAVIMVLPDEVVGRPRIPIR